MTCLVRISWRGDRVLSENQPCTGTPQHRKNCLVWSFRPNEPLNPLADIRPPLAATRQAILDPERMGNVADAVVDTCDPTTWGPEPARTAHNGPLPSRRHRAV